MTIGEALRYKLLADAAVAAIVGTRIYVEERPQDAALPAIAFEEITGAESFQDMTAGSVGLAVTPYQFNCYAATPDAAAPLREAVRVALQNHINAVMGTGSPLAGVHVWACIFTGSGGGWEPVTGNAVRSVDFDVIHQQASS